MSLLSAAKRDLSPLFLISLFTLELTVWANPTRVVDEQIIQVNPDSGQTVAAISPQTHAVKLRYQAAVIEQTSESQMVPGTPEEFRGVPVKVYEPEVIPANSKLPVVFFLQGGPGKPIGVLGEESEKDRHEFFAKLASQGYRVVVSSHRGSLLALNEFISHPTEADKRKWDEGREWRQRYESYDDLHPQFADDLVDVVNTYKQLSTSDSSKIFGILYSMGAHWGGRAMIKDPYLFNKTVYLAGVSNLGAWFFGMSPKASISFKKTRNYLESITNDLRLQPAEKLKRILRGMSTFFETPNSRYLHSSEISWDVPNTAGTLLSHECQSRMYNPAMDSELNQTCSISQQIVNLPEIDSILFYALDDPHVKMDQGVDLFKQINARNLNTYCRGVFFGPSLEPDENTHRTCVRNLKSEMHKEFFREMTDFFNGHYTQPSGSLKYKGKELMCIKELESEVVSEIDPDGNQMYIDYVDSHRRFQSGEAVMVSEFHNGVKNSLLPPVLVKKDQLHEEYQTMLEVFRSYLRRPDLLAVYDQLPEGSKILFNNVKVLVDHDLGNK